MLIALGAAVVVLAAAIVVLFAMVAELAARVPGRSEPGRPDPAVLPVREARLGREPGSWPHELPSPERCVVLALSTICRSCAGIAAQLDSAVGWDDLGILVIAADEADAGEFVRRHGLHRFRYRVDEKGEWISEEFGVHSSPTALVFREGKLESAYTFNDLAALRRKTESQKEGQGAVI